MLQRGSPRIEITAIQSDEGDGPIEIFRDRLTLFRFIDKDRGVDKAEFTLINNDRACHDSPYLRNGEKFLVSWGYQDEMSIARRMVVKKAGQAGFNYVVHAKDESVLLDRKRERRVWHGVRDSDVARELFSFNGYNGILANVVETETVRASVTQNTSDARMLQRLANRNGYVWWIDAAGGHFTPRMTSSEPFKWFTYRGFYDGDGIITAEGPQIEANLSKDIAKVRVLAIDAFTHEEVVAEVGAADEEETLGDYINRHIASLGEDQEVGDPDNPEGNRQARISRTEEINLGIATQDEVNETAQAIYREVAGGRYKMNMPIHGEPLLGAKMLIGLRDYSTIFDGMYYVKEAVTTISKGEYRMELRTRRDALGKLRNKNVMKVKKKKNQSKDEKKPPREKLERVATWGIGSNNEKVKMWAYVDKSGVTHYLDQMTPTEASQVELPGF
jgi:hypothetical protein